HDRHLWARCKFCKPEGLSTLSGTYLRSACRKRARISSEGTPWRQCAGHCGQTPIARGLFARRGEQARGFAAVRTEGFTLPGEPAPTSLHRATYSLGCERQIAYAHAHRIEQSVGHGSCGRSRSALTSPERELVRAT